MSDAPTRAPTGWWSRAPADWRVGVPWLFGLVAFGIAANKLIGGYDDLGIYLDAAREFQQGGIDLYREREHSGPWPYPVWTVLPFVALESAFGNFGARLVWCALLGVAVALLLRGLAQTVRTVGGIAWWQWLVFGFLFQRCMAQNLSHGNVGLWVGALVAIGIADLVRERPGRAGVWLGMAAAIKLTPVLFVAALPLMGRWRSAATMLLTIAVCVLALPIPFCGYDEHVRHLHDFWHKIHEAILTPGGSAISNGTGPNIKCTIEHLLQPVPADDAGHTVNLLDVDDGTLRVVMLTWSAMIAGLLLAWFLIARRHPLRRRLVEQSGAVLMATVFFAPLTRVYHLAAALLPAVWFCRGPRGRRDGLWLAVAIVLALTVTLRQRKLLGVTLWRYLDLGPFLHLALVGMTVWLVLAARRGSTDARGAVPAATSPGTAP